MKEHQIIDSSVKKSLLNKAIKYGTIPEGLAPCFVLRNKAMHLKKIAYQAIA
jgi:hypothetical protein